MLGCFGRKKKAKHGSNSKQPIDKAQKSEAGDEHEQETRKSPQQPISRAAEQQQQQTEVVVAKSNKTPDSTVEPAPIKETITVARAQSLHQEAPPASAKEQPNGAGGAAAATGGGGGIGVRKAATLGRYDFLKRYDRDSFNDRWSTLKQQYLSPKPNGAVDVDQSAGDDTVDSSISSPPAKPARPSPLRVQALPPPKLPLSPGFLANARSLPRQFSPPSTVVSPVKFSNWFHERKTQEDEARKECQDREERMQKIIEGPTEQQREDAAAKIQAGFRGHQARVAFKERQEQKRIEEAKKKEAAAFEAAAAEAAAAEAAASEAAAAEAAAAEAGAAEAADTEAAATEAAAEAAAAEAAAAEAAAARAAATKAAAAEDAAAEAAAIEAAAADTAPVEASASETAAAEAVAAQYAAAEAATEDAAAEAAASEAAAAEAAAKAAAAEAARAEASEDSTSEFAEAPAVECEPVQDEQDFAALQADSNTTKTEEVSNENAKTDSVDEDKSNADAAVKIQAGFRGMQARKEVAVLRKQRNNEDAAGTNQYHSYEPTNRD